MTSTGELRGLENCPAILPNLTTGIEADDVNTSAICKMTLKVSLILSGWNSAKLSAQSPPCNKKALPSTTLANSFFNDRDSPANTKGGNLLMFFNTESNSALSS